MQAIMFATDGSPSAEAALHEAIDLAKTLGAPLLAVSVAHYEAPFYGTYYGYADIAAELRKVEVAHLEEVLDHVEEVARAAGARCTSEQLEGVPGEQICAAARRHGVRLLVVGAHGWGRLGRLIHGSVSTYVLHHAPCPVLVVQGEAPEAPVLVDGTAARAR